VSVISTTRPYAFATSGNIRTRFVGFGPYTFPAGQATSVTEPVTEPIFLQGGYFWMQGPARGDTVTLEVVDVDDVLGGGANTVVSTYVAAMPVAPWDHTGELAAPTAGNIPAGLYLRITYTSTGASDVHMGVTYRWYAE
jgi:hypothetical protein